MSSRRLLLLGGTGRLGSALQNSTPSPWTVIAPGREQLDLAGAEVRDWQHWIKATAPNVVLNAAAKTWVDACEKDPQSASQINGLAPGLMARACAVEAVPFLHVSTDYVFGGPSAGCSAPYAEDSELSPVQHYGHSKAAGESAVLAAGGQVSIVRISWLTAPDEDLFVRSLLTQARGGAEEIQVLRQQLSRPTMTPGLSRWLFAVADRLADGREVPRILHPAGCDPVTRGEWAEHLLDHHGYGMLRVVDDPQQKQSPEYAIRGGSHLALRPRDSRLDVTRTMRWSREQQMPELDDWRSLLEAEGS
jgi:dTDP-4-dehydrorhamnose reductase